MWMRGHGHRRVHSTRPAPWRSLPILTLCFKITPLSWQEESPEGLPVFSQTGVRAGHVNTVNGRGAAVDGAPPPHTRAARAGSPRALAQLRRSCGRAGLCGHCAVRESCPRVPGSRWLRKSISNLALETWLRAVLRVSHPRARDVLLRRRLRCLSVSRTDKTKAGGVLGSSSTAGGTVRETDPALRLTCETGRPGDVGMGTGRLEKTRVCVGDVSHLGERTAPDPRVRRP